MEEVEWLLVPHPPFSWPLAPEVPVELVQAV